MKTMLTPALSGIQEAEARTQTVEHIPSRPVAVRSKRTTLIAGVTLGGTKRKGILLSISQYILSLRHAVLNTRCQGGDASHNECSPTPFDGFLHACTLARLHAGTLHNLTCMVIFHRATKVVSLHVQVVRSVWNIFFHTTNTVTRGVLPTWDCCLVALCLSVLGKEVQA